MKGQAALEFLSTYAWAIMVVLITFGSLAYFGFTDPTGTKYQKCDLWPEFSCDASRVLADGTVQLQIRNNLGEMGSVQVIVNTTDCIITSPPYTEAGTKPNRFLDYTGDEIIEFSCSGPLRRGSDFEGEVSVTYIERYETISHTKTGLLSRTVE